MGKSTTKASTGKSRLSEPIRGYAEQGMSGAQQLYADPSMAGLPGLYNPISQQRQQAYQQLQQPLDFGNAGQQGLDEWGNVVQGNYLDVANNPYLQGVVGSSMAAAQAPIAGSFNQGNRYGSGLFANASLSAAASTASRLFGEMYMNERSNMMNALGQTTQMQTLDERLRNPGIEQAQRLEYVGQQFETDQQSQLTEQNRQFMWPYMQQQIYESSVGTSPLGAENIQSGTSGTPFNWGAMLTALGSSAVSGGGTP